MPSFPDHLCFFCSGKLSNPKGSEEDIGDYVCTSCSPNVYHCFFSSDGRPQIRISIMKDCFYYDFWHDPYHGEEHQMFYVYSIDNRISIQTGQHDIKSLTQLEALGDRILKLKAFI